MTALSIFGLTLTIAPGGTASHNEPGLSVAFELDGTGTKLRVEIDGKLDCARFVGVSLTAGCQDVAGRLILENVAAVPSQGTITITIGGNAIDAVAAGARVENTMLRFNHPATMASELVQATGNPLAGFVSFERLQYWRASRLELDVPGEAITLQNTDDRPRARLRHEFGVGGAERAFFDQYCRLFGVRLQGATAAALFESRVGAIFLNPDILDATSALDDFENGLLFQQVAAQSRLEAELAVAGGGWEFAGWRLAPAAKRMILAAPSLRDEHGHPLAMEVAEPLPLAKRFGHLDPQLGGKLNEAVVLGVNDRAFTTPVTVVAVDPLTTYGKARQPLPLAADRTIEAPYWVTNRVAQVLGTRPREILGWSANAAIATGDDRQPLEGTLRLSPVHSELGDLLFMEASLAFASEGMTLRADVPERATFARDGGMSPIMQRYHADGRDSEVALPLCDLGWAFADVAGPRQDPDRQPLAATIRSWTTKLNEDLCSGFPKAALDHYVHSEGHRANAPTQPFVRLIAPPPATTLGEAGRLISALAPKDTELGHPNLMMAPLALAPAPASSTAFLFGGSLDDGAIGDAQHSLEIARHALGGDIEAFLQFWAGHDLIDIAGIDPAPARRALRKYLVGEPALLRSPDYWDLADLVEASSRLSEARDMLSRNPPTLLGFDAYGEALEAALPDEVAELLDPAGEDGVLSRIFQYAFSPGSIEVLKRAIAAIWSAETPPPLAAHLPVLEAIANEALAKALAEFFSGAQRPGGLIAELIQGLSPLIGQVEALWRDHAGLDAFVVALLDRLNARYGPLFTPEVFARVLADESDAADLLEALQAIGLPIVRLADLSFEPPDYLIVSRRLRDAGVGTDASKLHPVDQVAALWNHRFDFCSFGGGKAWDMFLGEETTLLVKLGGERGLDAILAEAHKSYVSPGRRDPLGLALEVDTDDPVSAFAPLLPLELRYPEWRGVLVINPTIDLERDPVLSALCGFPHIGARFAAVGGHTPAVLQGVDLDVWGRIERRARSEGWASEKGDPLDKMPDWGGVDVGWALTKFEATIKNTTILSGEISFLLQVRELFGRRDLAWPDIVVSGALRPAEAPASGSPRDFSFGASFEEPLKLDVDVAFLEMLYLRGVRVGSHDGDTTLDIDADLQCREWSLGRFDFELPDAPVRLSDFRIRMPLPRAGLSIPMGIRRALAIDLGAIRFPVLGERQFCIGGLEIKPVGVGMIRDERDKVLARLARETMTVVEPDMPTPGRYAYPYIDTRISFGNGPELGGGSELALVGRVGVPVSDPGVTTHDPGFGIASLDARDLSISLFRLMTIEASRVRVGILPLHDPDDASKPSTETVGVVDVEGFNLKLLSWALFDDDDERRLIFAQKTERGGGRGMLAWYSTGDDEPDGAFFRLHWLLIARNFDPGKGVLDALITPGGEDVETERKAIGTILSGDPPDERLNARIAKDDPWLFGIRFDLGELFKPCALVLYDQHYYGIRLGGVIPRLLTGEDELTFAYIPGAEPALDRFRTEFRCAAFDLMSQMRSGVMALEWSPCWDFLIDCGQPWRGPNGYDWERAFSIPVGAYEAKFGFFVERRTSLAPPPSLPADGSKYVTFSAGAGFYFGYRFEITAGIAWVRAGIGIFGVLIGSATLKLPKDSDSGNPLALLKGSLAQLQVVGVLGIYAYGEGGVEVWILSARFRVSAQAFVEVTLTYLPHARSRISWDATLSAHYSASVRVGSGWFSWTFRVSGAVAMSISGSAAFG